MARSLTDDGQPLASWLTITPEQDAALRRLIHARPTAHHAELLAALGLNPEPDQP